MMYPVGPRLSSAGLTSRVPPLFWPMRTRTHWRHSCPAPYIPTDFESRCCLRGSTASRLSKALRSSRRNGGYRRCTQGVESASSQMNDLLILINADRGDTNVAGTARSQGDCARVQHLSRFNCWLEHYNTERRHGAPGGRPVISRLLPTSWQGTRGVEPACWLRVRPCR